ncbi:hypothetical protein SFC07_13180 [Corynebacterium callunae]|uniref:hypothetical protein n=1 Tax=Corynebacterium callunae TaxID=1721 RepID=UPI003982411E
MVKTTFQKLLFDASLSSSAASKSRAFKAPFNGGMCVNGYVKVRARIPTARIYLVLLTVWIATPFMGDRAPLWTQWVYWIGLVMASLIGIVVAARAKDLLLGVVSALTFFAWPLVLIVALAFM